jgi:presenilin-like A22 family membrane protease
MMFLVTQFIGLYVVNYYSPVRVSMENGEKIVQNVSAPELPYGMQTPELNYESQYISLFPFIIFAFIIAIFLMFILSKFRVKFFIKLWFFAVVVLALGISFNSFLHFAPDSSLIALVIAVPLAFIKVYRRNFLIHNSTELLIYPGIAAVFVPVLNFLTIAALLILISLYDIWAVWHSGFMQKMAKYQIDNLQIFSGFFVPYTSKKLKNKIKKMKMTLKKSELKKKRIRVNVAILGGGDVIFPIIAAGVMMKTFGIFSALFVVLGATLGLTYLLINSEKRKFYPAMPFITAGIFIGMALSYIIL